MVRLRRYLGTSPASQRPVLQRLLVLTLLLVMASAGQVFAARTLTNTLTATPTTVGYGGSVTLNGTIA